MSRGRPRGGGGMRGRAVVFTVALLIPPLPAGLRGATPTSVVAVMVEVSG